MAQPKKPRRAELKGLMNQVFSERWTPFSGFAGPPKRGDADLLIQKGLLVRWRRTGGEALLNLKDLLPVLPPSLKRVFENGPILTPLFWCRIVPNSAISCQNVAEYGIKSTFFATDFIGTGDALRLGAIPMSPEHTNWPAGRGASPERSSTDLSSSNQRISRAGRRVGWLPIWLN